MQISDNTIIKHIHRDYAGKSFQKQRPGRTEAASPATRDVGHRCLGRSGSGRGLSWCMWGLSENGVPSCTLWLCQQFAIEHGPVEIVDLPINSMVIFQFAM